MNNPIRVKYFLWLAALLVAFFAVNSISLLLINLQVILGRDHDWQDELYEWLLITGVGAAVLPLLLLAAWRISRLMLAPLRHIARAALRIRGGHLAERIRVPATHDEIAVLAESINQAFDRYQEAVRRQQQFSGTASHQLRTPLTSIRTIGEIALTQERTADEYRDAIGSMLEEADRLSHIVEQLLMLARLGGEEMRKTFEPVNVATLIEEVTSQFDPIYRIKNIAVTQEIDPSLQVHGHKALLHQTVANILDNAIRHTPEQGTIEVQATRDNISHVRLIVRDSGPGFTDNQLERLKRVSTDDADDAADVSGPGLGLTIVADIVRLHRGVLSVDTAPSGGAHVTVRLPANPAVY